MKSSLPQNLRLQDTNISKWNHKITERKMQVNIYNLRGKKALKTYQRQSQEINCLTIWKLNTFDKGTIFKIYKEPLKLNNKKITLQN